MSSSFQQSGILKFNSPNITNRKRFVGQKELEDLDSHPNKSKEEKRGSGSSRATSYDKYYPHLPRPRSEANIDFVYNNGILSSPEEKIIKNYRILSHLGAGSFGKVYLCEHIKTKIKYALKV